MSAEILIVDDNADIRNIINELIIDGWLQGQELLLITTKLLRK